MVELEKEFVEDAIELVSNGHQEGTRFHGSEKERKIDGLTQYFANEFPADTDGLRVSNDKLEEKIQDLLSESKSRDEPAEAFEEEFRRLPARIKEIPLKSYQLGIPLNLSEGITFQEIGFGDYCFELISREEWMEKFASPAFDDDDFSNQLEVVPNSFSDDYTYWMLEYEARDSKHVLEIADRYLGVIIGQLIYCLFDWTQSNRFDGETAWNRPWSELRLPFVYILLEEGEFQGAFFDDDISPRQTIEMYRDRQEHMELRYDQIPPLENPNETEGEIINAFKNFQSGATEADRQQAFLDYWRAVETLCKFDEDDKMETVGERARTVIREQDSLLEERFDEVTNKRNSLVHEKVGVTITNRDNEFLRRVIYSLVPFMLINREWERDKIEEWLDQSSNPTPNLEHKLQTLENDIEEKSRDAAIARSILQGRRKRE